MDTIQQLVPLIYHERQQPGEMLCAQHALNSLLQGQYFSAPDLSEIARELDEHESTQLDVDERATSSNNMDDTGFFSVQVLQKALTDSFNLSLVPWDARELRPYHDHPHTQMAFVLNQSQHWYTLRRFGNVSPNPALDADPGGGHWFNLNSSNAAPERISKLYLGMFLQQAKEEGYTIFAVVQPDLSTRLALPRVEVDDIFGGLPDDIPHSSTYEPSSRQAATLAGFEDEDMELQAALQASLTNGDYDYVPPPPPSAAMSRPTAAPSSASTSGTPFARLPSRTASAVPVERGYHAPAPADEDDEDEEMDDDYAPPRRAPRHEEPVDPVAASIARQRRVADQMRRAQELALQEGLADEIARIDAATRARAGRRAAGEEAHEDEDEMLRRAIAESEAMARAGAEDDEDDDGDDGGGAATPAAREPAPAPPQAQWQQHRMYDDEDAELQAALRASLESAPEGFVVPEPGAFPQSRPPPAQAHTQTVPPPVPAQSHLQPPPLQRQPSDDFETESEDTADEPEPEQLSMEEIRRRRLARFGG
ncbi:Josephin-domain-containing protein [Epithele typhae]|uniref:Josephin-domain-containing protein n=1 Tax=Epithele typhae TaxID=378194 RepID=UPI002007FB45|nr:Josephin-domain-containing protein [Epithele typhae]KAH9942503.1 Josephin-domain-containing protein [Epithele typhae]